MVLNCFAFKYGLFWENIYILELIYIYTKRVQVKANVLLNNFELEIRGILNNSIVSVEFDFFL